MNRFKLIVVFFVLCLNSCTDAGKKSETTNNDSVSTMKLATDSNVITAAIDSSHTAQTSLAWAGTYSGTLPCETCDGVETEIMLHKGDTYMISTKSLGTPKTAREIHSEGRFTWVNGSIIQLEDETHGPSIYAVEENKLIQLDSEGKRIEGSAAAKYILTKQ